MSVVIELAADAVLGAEQRDELYILRMVQPVDRRHARRIDARLIRDQADALAFEQLEVARDQHVDAEPQPFTSPSLWFLLRLFFLYSPPF